MARSIGCCKKRVNRQRNVCMLITVKRLTNSPILMLTRFLVSTTQKCSCCVSTYHRLLHCLKQLQRYFCIFRRRNSLWTHQGGIRSKPDVTVCGHTKEEYDQNLRFFLDIANENNLTLNGKKCVFASDTINLLGYRITNGQLQPDPEKMSQSHNTGSY